VEYTCTVCPSFGHGNVSSTAFQDSFLAVNDPGFPKGKENAMLRFTILKTERAE
jgi:hypothetical protein